jgi:type I restriction enzyme S subunit
MPGDVPYWGAGGVLDSVDRALFNEPLVLLGEDGAPFFEPGRPVAFLLDGLAWVNNHIHVLRPNAKVDRRFLVHALNAVDFAAYITGSTRDKLTQDDMWQIRVPLLPVHRQRKIADYLDRETARIDNLIAAKQRMVELLELRRRTLIARFMEALPAKYGATRIKRVAVMRAGGTPTVDDPAMWADNGTPWVAISDMTASRVIVETHRTVSTAGLQTKRLPLGCPGTLLFAMYASVGATAELGITATWNQAILGIAGVPSLCETRFLDYWLQFLRNELRAIVRSNTQDNLNAEQVGNLPFPVVPVTTQQQIVASLDAVTTQVDRFLARNARSLDLLIERRQALITAAVTGQLDIPEAA